MKPIRNNTLVRLRWARRRAKRLGLLAVAGAKVDYRSTDVRKTWLAHGWKPPQKELA